MSHTRATGPRRATGRRLLLATAALLLLLLALGAITGAIRQLPRAHTGWQKAETWIQLASGGLALLLVVDAFVQTRWSGPLRTAWTLSLVSAAGLSSLVWGPPLPVIALLFAAVALGVARGLLWSLQVGSADG